MYIVRWINDTNSRFGQAFSKLEDAYLQLSKVLAIKENTKVFLEYTDTKGNQLKKVQYR